MTLLDCGLIVGWLVWLALLVACRATYAELRHRLAGVDPGTGEALRARDELRFTEPLRWYLRFRRYLRQDAAHAAGVETITRRLKRLLDLAEIEFVLLFLAIIAFAAHSAFTGA